MRFSSRITRLLSLLLVAVFVLAGCGGSADKKDTPHTLRVGVLSIDDSLPIFVAAAEDRFKAAGLQVEIFPFKSSSDQSKAMESGELDIVMNDMIVQGLMKKAGKDTRILSYAFGATPQEGRFVVVGAPNSGIQSSADLAGKKVAISSNTMMEFLMDQYAVYEGIDAAAMEYVNMPNLMLRVETVLEGKDVQAAILPDPLASFALMKGCTTVIDDTTLSENFSQSVYLVDAKVLEQAPDDVKAFMDVVFKAMEDINAKPDAYRALALEKANVPEALQAGYRMPTFTPQAVPSEKEVTRVQDWLVKKQLLTAPYAYEDVVDTRFVKNA